MNRIELYLTASPLMLSMWLLHDLRKCVTNEDFVNLHSDWLNKSEISTNEVAKQHYEDSARILFETLTNKSYLSKIV
jgi:hypothetical protein